MIVVIVIHNQLLNLLWQAKCLVIVRFSLHEMIQCFK